MQYFIVTLLNKYLKKYEISDRFAYLLIAQHRMDFVNMRVHRLLAFLEFVGYTIEELISYQTYGQKDQP